MHEVLAALVAVASSSTAADGRFTAIDVFALEYAADPQVSPDGEQIVYRRRANDIMLDRTGSDVWIVDVDGDRHRPLLAGPKSYSSPRWSPSGDRLAYRADTDNGQNGIWVRWMDTGQTALIAAMEEAPGDLAWSPDGEHIAFTRDVAADTSPLAKPPEKPEGASWADAVTVIDRARYRADGAGFLDPAYEHIFIVPALGGTPRQLTDGPFNHGGPLNWTPDGTEIVFAANRNDDWEYQTIEADIFSVSVDDGALRQITNEPGRESSPRLSPNGRQLAFLKSENVPEPVIHADIVVMDLDGGDRRVLTGDLDRDPGSIRWSGDREVYFTVDDRGLRNIARVTTAGRISTVVRNIGGTTVGRPYLSGAFSVSANGVLAFPRGGPDRPGDLWVRARGEERQLTALNEDLLAHKTLGDVKEFTYASSLDGQEIHAWYITPPDYDPSRPYPMILEIHGGPHLAYGPHFSAEMQMMASAGYVVFYNNYRGSSSYGRDFEMLLKYKYSSPDDFADHMSGIDHLIAQGVVDEDNLFIAGGSAGGIATAYAIGLTDRFNAAAAIKPVINWVSKTLTADSYISQIRHQFPGMPWEEPDHYWERSPLSLVENVTTPTLLLTGEEDYRTPMSETEQFYQALKLRRVDTVMVRVPGASHGIAGRPSRLIAKIDNMLAWFDKYRADAPPTDASNEERG